MTDWDKIQENISHAMEASSQFNEIGEKIIETPNEVAIREFATSMVTLQKELQDILILIGPASPVALDEIVDAFTQAIYGQPSKFRLTPSLPSKETEDA